MRGYSIVALQNPKTGVNVGSVIRNAGCYNLNSVVIAGKRAKHYMKYMPTDTQAASKHRPVFLCEDVFEMLPHNCVPVAVDLVEGAQPLGQYEHPERAFYIFGPEDSTLGKNILNRCRDTIYIPTNQCLNLSTSTGVVMHDRCLQRSFPVNEVTK